MRLGAKSDETLVLLASEVRSELLRRRGSIHRCTACGREFIARAGARTCSTTCRVRALRARTALHRRDHHMIGIGYEGLQLPDLIERLRDEGVSVLVDIRLNAISRKAGYSKRALSAALEAAGIRYLHDPRLGNPKENRAGYAEAGSHDGTAAREHFRELLDSEPGAQGIRELANLLEQETVAVLCYEADEAHCHREQVIAAVRESQHSLVTV